MALPNLSPEDRARALAKAAEARREQVRLVAAAHDEANAKAKEREAEVRADMGRKVADVRKEAEAEEVSSEKETSEPVPLAPTGTDTE